MTTGKALDGSLYAGNPHVRVDEGEAASATPRRGSLLYKTINHRKVKAFLGGHLLQLVALLTVISASSIRVYAADTYRLSSNEGSESLASYGFFDPTLWSPSSATFDPEADYKVEQSALPGKLLTIKATATCMFGGGRIVLGSNQYGWVDMLSGCPNAISFGTYGLRIQNGGIYCRSSNRKCLTDGIVTLAGAYSSRKMSVIWSADDFILRHKGSLASDTVYPFYVGGTNGLVKAWRKGTRLELIGNLTACTSPITLVTENAEATSAPEVTLAVGNTTLPCIVTVSENGALATFKGSSPIVGSVSFIGNNWLECSRTMDESSVGEIAVTGVFSVANGPVKVKPPRRSPSSDGTYPVLRFPATSAVGESDFVLTTGPGSDCCTLSFALSGADKVLSLVYDGLPVHTSLVYQLTSSADLGVSESWSDGTSSAQCGKRYLVDVDVFSDDTPTATLYVPSTAATVSFSGDSLTIGKDCSLVFRTGESYSPVFRCGELNLEDGSSVSGTKVNYTLDGGTIHVDGTVRFAATSGRNLYFKSPIAGSGTLKLESVKSGSSEPYGYYALKTPNTNYFGAIDTTLAQTRYAAFGSQQQRLYISYGTSLGGSLPALDRTSLILNHYVKFIPDGSDVEIARESNRGIVVRNGAEMSVAEGRSLVIGTPISLAGELRKTGGGVLSLKGAAAGFGESGLGAVPTEGQNVFSVQAGTLQIGSVDAINGMSVAFDAGTSLVLLPNFDDMDLMRYGIRNVKTDTPYALGEGLASLPFSIGAATGTPPSQRTAFRMGLMTVPDNVTARTIARTAAQTARFSLKGFKCALVEDDASEPGVVTFAFDYTPLGMCISVR